MALTLRNVKQSPLTHGEMDNNLTYLNNNLVQSASGNGNSTLTLTKQGGSTVTVDLLHSHVANQLPSDITVMSNCDTDDLSEGDNNKYFTNARVDTQIDSHLSGGTGIDYNAGTISVVDTAINSLYQPDGTNKFVYTDNAGALHIDGDIIQSGSAIDHNSLTNYDANEHVDHTAVNISTSGIISGGGDLTESRTITLNHSDVDHDQTTNYDVAQHFIKEDINSLYQPDGTNKFVYTDNAGALHIDGDIIQSGSAYEVNAETVTTTQELIVTRDGATTAISAGDVSGLEVNKYDGTNNLLFGTDLDGYFKVGESGELQILATREDIPNNTSVPFWNNTENRFDTSSNLTWDGSDLSVNSTVVVLTNDSRLSNSRPPTGTAGGDLSGTYPNPSVVNNSHTHNDSTINGLDASSITTGTLTRPTSSSSASCTGNAATATTATNCSRSILAGTGLTGGGALTANRSLTVSYGTTSGTACQGNDSRLSNARTPVSHSYAYHSDINQALLTSSDVRFDSLGIGTTASGTTGHIRATNDIIAYYSDERLKNFSSTIPNALDKVKQLHGYYFTENEKAKEFGFNNDKQQVGVSAQEIQKILPEVVTAAPFDIAQNEDGTEYSKSGENYLTVAYDKIVPLLIEAIKEQEIRISELEGKI